MKVDFGSPRLYMNMELCKTICLYDGVIYFSMKVDIGSPFFYESVVW